MKQKKWAKKKVFVGWKRQKIMKSDILCLMGSIFYESIIIINLSYISWRITISRLRKYFFGFILLLLKQFQKL